MPYNNAFPVGYPYYVPTQSNALATQMNINPTQPTQNSGIIWVQGEAGAKSYLVAPNSTVQLWDSESQTIYLKSADASGMPSMRILDYKIRENTPIPEAKPNYVTMDQFDGLKKELDDLKSSMKKEK